MPTVRTQRVLDLIPARGRNRGKKTRVGPRRRRLELPTDLYARNLHGDLTPAQRSRPRGSKLRVIGYVIGGSKLGLPRPVVGRSHRGFDEAIGDGRRAPFMRDDVRRAEALRG